MSKQSFIEWELERDPQVLERFHSGKQIDAGALRHVICNIDPPEGVSFDDTMKVLNAVAEAVQLIPVCDSGIAREEAVRRIAEMCELLKDWTTDDKSPDYKAGMHDGCVRLANYSMEAMMKR